MHKDYISFYFYCKANDDCIHPVMILGAYGAHHHLSWCWRYLKKSWCSLVRSQDQLSAQCPVTSHLPPMWTTARWTASLPDTEHAFSCAPSVRAPLCDCLLVEIVCGPEWREAPGGPGGSRAGKCEKSGSDNDQYKIQHVHFGDTLKYSRFG